MGNKAMDDQTNALRISLVIFSYDPGFAAGRHYTELANETTETSK